VQVFKSIYCHKINFGKQKMARGIELTAEKRAQIVILQKQGNSYREISKILQVSLGAVQKAIARNRETGLNTDRKRSGRPRKTVQRVDNKIYAISKADRFKSASTIRAEINRDLDSHISLTTVKRRLREKGMIGRIAVKKPLLRTVNKQKRLDFAKEHIDWTIEQWKSVLWTDESKFQLFGSNRRQYVRRKPNERYIPQCVLPTVKHGGGSVMVWGCFSYGGVGELVKVEGIMRKEQYHNILQRHAIPSGTELIGPNFIFQQDNDPKHTSTHELFKAKGTRWCVKSGEMAASIA
jgi:transposase